MEHMAEDYDNGIARVEGVTSEEEKKEIVQGKLDEIYSVIQRFQHEEYQYLNIIHNIIDNGTWEEGRNGKTKSIFGNMMRFSLKDGKIPILTTKKTAWKTCLKELLWFIRGKTNNKW